MIPSAPDVAQVLDGLLGALMRDDHAQVAALENHPALERARQALASNDPQQFYLAWGYPAKRLANALVQSHVAKRPRAAFIFNDYDFANAHLREVFAHFEGGACCADKSRWALNAVLRHELEGIPIKFSVSSEAPFWEPRRVLRSQEELLAFIDALAALKHGRPQTFFARWSRLTETAASTETQGPLP